MGRMAEHYNEHLQIFMQWAEQPSPCPDCGSKEIYVAPPISEGGLYFVRCSDCGRSRHSKTSMIDAIAKFDKID